MADPVAAALRRVTRVTLFVLSASLAALALRLAWEYPLGAAAGLGGLAVGIGLRWLSRRRALAMLRSGDVRLVLARWAASLSRVPHAETMAPLMTATALAAYGWVERARAVLQTARRGPVWEAALEHRLFVDALLLTFEGDAAAALDRAKALEELPLPSSAPWLTGRIRTLRRAVGALARAFAHLGEKGDRKLLLRAGDASPLVYWAMRYGAAILAVDARDLRHARRLLDAAPSWPEESCFSAFHREISGELERLSAEPVPD
jgi:hypothetical protein